MVKGSTYTGFRVEGFSYTGFRVKGFSYTGFRVKGDVLTLGSGLKHVVTPGIYLRLGLRWSDRATLGFQFREQLTMCL